MNTIIKENPWSSLTDFTAARIALGRTGVSLPTNKSLSFLLDHARAKDAVLDVFNDKEIAAQAEKMTGSKALRLTSAASHRKEYLMRPDLGRKLSVVSSSKVKNNKSSLRFDLSITAADGLSARAIHENFKPFMEEFLPYISEYSCAPVSVVTNGRVAIADEIAYNVGATLAIILIGERPGLKSPNSMGIYMTYNATPGTTDERRNCISNVRPEGLSYAHAASKLAWLMQESIRRQISGVNLKDEHSLEEIQRASAEPEFLSAL
jgi:ethanolamine ammonia-lyase small subunit